MDSTRRTFVANVAAALSLLGCSSCKQAASEQTGGRDWNADIELLKKKILQTMAELHVPGLSIAIIRDAKIAWRGSLGVRDQATGAPVNEQTMFSAQSMSKPVFAYRVMKLCEQGVLNLDTPLTKYTKDAFVEGDPRLDLITPRRVLSHTTGLPNWRSKDEPLRINFTPGAKWMYSGEGYHYLQTVVTQLTGRSDAKNCSSFEQGYRTCATDFGDYMAENLLRPMGMTSSGYVWTEQMGRNVAIPHDTNGQPLPHKHGTAVDVARYGSAGSLVTTASDYAKFLIEVMDPKPADAYRLNGESLKEMLRPQIGVPDAPVKMSWALGWQIWHQNNGDMVAHGGDDTGFHSEAAFSPLRRSGFVILTNGDGGGKLIMERILADLVTWFV